MTKRKRPNQKQTSKGINAQRTKQPADLKRSAEPVRPSDYDPITDLGPKAAPACTPGSIEQQLDMCESGPYRGDEILHSHENSLYLRRRENDEEIKSLDEIMNFSRPDMSEINREGDEMSGDEHSSGLQGDEPDLHGQEHIDGGLPGEQTEDDEKRITREEKRRIA